MDDSVLYTGTDGLFGNEVVEESVQDKINEQERRLSELTPQLEDILEMIENEKRLTLEYLASNSDNGWTENGKTMKVEDIALEVKAAGRYRKYLDGLKTQFQLKLNGTNK